MKGEAIMKQKQQSNGDIKLGKFISLILRHQPSVIGISLDENGWADVSELIAGINRSGRQIDLSILERIVAQNDKQRYCFNQDHTKIRANQGHSISVDIQLQQKKPPALLYHGTATAFLKSITKDGIKKQSRQHVHLSKDKQTAVDVGIRHGIPAVLTIDAEKMSQDGYLFYLSQNGIWLCDYIPPNYIIKIEH